MKKIKLLIGLVFFSSVYIFAQNSAYLDIGNVKALIYSNGANILLPLTNASGKMVDLNLALSILLGKMEIPLLI